MICSFVSAGWKWLSFLNTVPWTVEFTSSSLQLHRVWQLESYSACHMLCQSCAENTRDTEVLFHYSCSGYPNTKQWTPLHGKHKRTRDRNPSLPQVSFSVLQRLLWSVSHGSALSTHSSWSHKRSQVKPGN